MRTIHGDLIKLALSGQFDVILHGCNCFHKMGAGRLGTGIAKPIRVTFPEAFAADLRTACGDRSKLGTISCATIVREGRQLTIVNGYTQYQWKGSGIKVDYPAIASVMRAVKLQFSGCRIGYPTIGAGLAGGDWKIISAIIEEELEGENHTLVVYQP